MKEKMYNTVDVLKTRVNYNLERIRENERKIRNLVENKTKTNAENNELIECFNENKKLLAENKEAINLQMGIIQYINQFRNEWKNEQFSNVLLSLNLSDEDIFEHTINGKLSFDVKHPKYKDEKFKIKLIEYYKEREDYEMCDLILKA